MDLQISQGQNVLELRKNLSKSNILATEFPQLFPFEFEYKINKEFYCVFSVQNVVIIIITKPPLTLNINVTNVEVKYLEYD